MTVKDLRDFLSRLPQDALVKIDDKDLYKIVYIHEQQIHKYTSKIEASIKTVYLQSIKNITE